MRSSKVVRASDWVFAGVCLAAAGILAVFLWSGKTAGENVVFRQNGKIVETVPLSENTRVELHGRYTNIFEIQDGQVRVVWTDCPNRQCEHTGYISSSGASIICVPNEVSASIQGRAGTVDAFTG